MDTHKEGWPLASQGVRLQEKERKTNFTDILILESCAKIPFCCSSHPACSILLQQPWPTNTDCTLQMTKEKSTIEFTEKTREAMSIVGAATRQGQYVRVYCSVCGGHLCFQICHKATASICSSVSGQPNPRAMNSNSLLEALPPGPLATFVT